MSDPSPPPSDPWPSEPPRTARQDHAVLAWLVIEADLPNAVHVHLVDALLAWAPLLGEHLFSTEPEPGVGAELRPVLEGMWWRLDAQAADARWADKVVLNEACDRLALALQALRALRAPARRLPEPRLPGG